MYCPERKKLVHLFDPLLNPHGPDLDKFEKKDFLGPDIPEDLAHGIAMGDFDPISKERFKDDENEKYLVQKALSYSSGNYYFNSKSKKDKKKEESDDEEETPLPKFLKDNPD